MGGDFGIEVTIPAVIGILRRPPKSLLGNDYRFILVGNESLIKKAISKHSGDKFLQNSALSIQHATEMVEMDEAPALALKKKKDSSMRVAINLVKEGRAQACVSAGNTGALMATAKFVLKTVKGIDRPAIISTLPTIYDDAHVHMLDLGANVDSSPEMLLQFAVMGSVLVQHLDKVKKPTIGLLNVGAEEIKGSEKVKKASELLTASDLNYVGYVEGDEIYENKVNVIVCDGFEGNIALKTSEGVVKLIGKVTKETFTKNIFTKLAALFILPVITSIKKRFDPRRYNGATLIGLNGVVVKSHGGADKTAFIAALIEAANQATLNVPEHVNEEVSKIIKQQTVNS